MTYVNKCIDPRDPETNKKTNIFLIIEYHMIFNFKLSTSHTLNGRSSVKTHEVRHYRSSLKYGHVLA